MKRLQKPHERQPRERGFTLIELMVTVAIVAILAGIAYPSYRDYVLRGRIVDATSGLSTMRANMERYFQDNRTYLSTGSYTSPCLVSSTLRMVGTFTLSCDGTYGAVTATGYTLVATGSGTTAGFIFTVDQSNNRATVGVPTGWTTCSSDWVTKRGAC
ncbi:MULTISPECIES: type IV pilin protein [unclassified Variovorax]|jgi:type IV pilus assembly protein PilE|uniref:type IV pilin protein n=1 Tax=unclassified Variovorax TaxID=663243 RepID=UPI000F7EF9A7|nr:MULTISPECIES: type IV pilin protein [unclassified Variovorax]RSZ30156.1 type IV pilin protein [Variovorax sp. 553]RSZ30723.1 type IV pilin protein [Variovorax sp. 679]